MAALATQRQTARQPAQVPASPSMRSHRSSIGGGTSHGGSHQGGPPVSVVLSWEVLRAPHGRITACAAAKGGARLDTS